MNDIFDAAELAYKTASVQKTALQPELATLAVTWTGLMLAEWLGDRGKKLAPQVAEKATESLAASGLTSLATLDKYAQQQGTSRFNAFVSVAGRQLALAAALTVGISVHDLMKGKAAPAAAAPQQQSQVQPQPEAPAQEAQAPAEQAPMAEVKDPFYEKDLQKQQDKQKMQQLRTQDNDEPQRQQGLV